MRTSGLSQRHRYDALRSLTVAVLKGDCTARVSKRMFIVTFRLPLGMRRVQSSDGLRTTRLSLLSMRAAQPCLGASVEFERLSGAAADSFGGLTAAVRSAVA